MLYFGCPALERYVFGKISIMVIISVAYHVFPESSGHMTGFYLPHSLELHEAI